MKRLLCTLFLLFYAATVCVNTSLAGEVATSSEFANAWNSGATDSITVSGTMIPEVNLPGIVLENSLNAFGGATRTLAGANGQPGGEAGTNALKLGSSSLIFMPGWDSPLSARIEDIAIYGATNGAVSYTGSGTGAHNLEIDDVFFYGNTGTIGGAVNVQSQMQSINLNQYLLTNSSYIANSAANGGAVAMAAHNSIFTTTTNTFSVTGTRNGVGDIVHVFGMNSATAGNGGGLYFMGDNALGVDNDFISRDYGYFQNSASGLGGAIFIGAQNGNDPSVNDFIITDNSFVENQAGSGGAVATSINGGSRNVNVTLTDNIYYSNIASGNGGALYNAVGDQYSPFGGAIKFKIGGLFVANRAASGGAIYNDLRPGQSTVTVDILKSPDPIGGGITLEFVNNTASGNGGAIYNTSNSGTAVVKIADGVNFQGNTAAYGGAIYNSGYGVINLNTLHNGDGIIFSDNSASSSANGADIYQASTTAVININGEGSGDPGAVSVNGGIAGVGTINQGYGFSGGSVYLNLGEKSQNFDFKGTYNLANLSVLNAYGLMFGGTNNIGGRANIHSGLNSFYFNANMQNYAWMDYFSSSTERTSIGAATSDSAPGIQFKGTGATVAFTREGFDRNDPAPDLNMPRALFTLTGRIDNGQANTIEFDHGDVMFGSTSFTGATEYKFLYNSVINLAGPLDPYRQYSFTNLTTDGTPLTDSSSLLSLRVGNDPGSLMTDTISVLSGGGLIDLGRVYINDANGVLTGRSRVIFGNVLKFENGRTQSVATANGTYTVTTVDDQYIQFTNTPNGSTDTTVNQDGSTTTVTDHSDAGGGSTTTNTNTDGGATTTTTDGNGNTTTTTANPDGSATFEHTAGDGTGITVIINGDGSGTVTVTPPGGGAGTTTFFNTGDTLPPIHTSGGTVTIDPTGGNTGVTFTDGGNTSSTVTVTPGGNTTTTVETDDGSGSSSTTTVTTNTDGSGSTVENPDGTTAATTPGGAGGATGTVTGLPTPTILTLNEVNTLTGGALTAGMSSADPRNFQIGGGVYQNASDLGTMAGGTFSVYGVTDGTGAPVLSGLNKDDNTTEQSLFTITGGASTTFRLENLTIENASSAAGGSVLNLNNNHDDTAAMLNTLTVRNNESTGNGGAVRIQDGAFLSTNVDYSGNTTDADGGALSNEGTGDTTVRGGAFTDNTAGGDGGAIYNDSGNDMTIASGTSLTFTGNTAGGDGGAIYNSGTITLIADSAATGDPNDGAITFSNNTVGGNPNDIHNDGGEIVFTGSGGVITLGGGVSGTGTLTKEGESTLVLGADADNSGFTGDFKQTKGITDANGEFFGGESEVTGGVLNWRQGASKQDSALLTVIDGGMINVAPGGTLRLANPDDLIDPSAATNLYGTIDLAGGAVYLSTQDQVSGSGRVNQSDGYLVVGGTGMIVPAGVVSQTGGVVRVEKEATVVLDETTPSFGGDLLISNATVSTNGHALNYGAGGGGLVTTSGSLAIGDNGLLDAADGAVHDHVFEGKFGVISDLNNGVGTDIANFSVDLDAQALRSDMFVFNDGTATSGTLIHGHPNQAALGDVDATTGTVVLSGLNLVTAPAVKVVPFTIMSSPNGFAGIAFAADMDRVETPIGPYSLVSLGEGSYELRFLSFAPRVHRGQAATLGAVSGQSHFTSLLFDHVHLDSFDCARDGRPSPWQFVREGRGLWAKPYFVRENLPFGGVPGGADNDAYGVVLGMDFPALSLGAGWKFLPTVFAAYNGGRQEFADVETTRDGGQAGFMGTLSRGRFAATVTGYAGGYRSAMKVAGHSDEPSNWFAGASAKAAYTVHAGYNLLFQPYALASYNAFGDQAWRSDYGAIDMKAGGFHGWNVAPGLSVAYNRDDWSVHASAQYTFALDKGVTGKVGELDLNRVSTGDGWLEYGLGASRRISDALLFEGKITVRSGSGTESYGGHVGFSWEF